MAPPGRKGHFCILLEKVVIAAIIFYGPPFQEHTLTLKQSTHIGHFGGNPLNHVTLTLEVNLLDGASRPTSGENQTRLR